MGNEVGTIRRSSLSSNGKEDKGTLAKVSRAGKATIRKRILSLDNAASFEDFAPEIHDKTPEVLEFIKESLSGSFLYECLHDDERDLFIGVMKEEKFARGSIIVKQGDVSDYFYLIDKGEVNCFVDGKKVTKLSRGSCFGELSLLYNSPRTATCQSKSNTVVWKIHHETFKKMVAAGEMNRKLKIIFILQQVPFLSRLDDASIHKVADAMNSISCIKGTRIVKKGEPGKHFYIIKEGMVKVHDIGFGDCVKADKMCSSGDFFGERALISADPRSANVTAITDCSMLYMARDEFHKVVGDVEHLLKADGRRQLLLSAPEIATSQLEPREIQELVELFEEVIFESGSMLAKAGQPVSKQGFYIIEEGIVRIVEEKGNIVTLIKDDHFGGDTLGLPDNYVSERTIDILKRTKLAFLSKESIKSVICSMSRLGEAQPFTEKLSQVTVNDLTQYRIIGGGEFGTVRLCIYNKTSEAYALKIMPKRRLLQENMVRNIIREKNIVASLDFPFIVVLIATFQDKHNAYCLYDFLHGGEMFNVIHSNYIGVAGKSQALFYTACILLSFIHLYNRRICYRHLKPENVLIDRAGYCVLIDFGNAKVVTEKTFTVCGEHEYLAPEIILCKGHSNEVDWWALGIFLYELLATRTPFYANDMDAVALFKCIVKGKFKFPDNGKFTDDTKDLIKKLLVKNPSKRLGSLAHGMRDIRMHEFFETMDWDKLYTKQLKAPWKPKIKGNMDPSYFDSYPEPELDDNNDDFTDQEQDKFKEF